MTQINNKVLELKQALLKMMHLTQNQLLKGREAIMEFDKDLAHEILFNENRLNAYELAIDNNCENILALYNPVAIDLRFVLSVYKINSNLERIGDYAAGIARFILHFNQALEPKVLVDLRFLEMYDAILKMFNYIVDGFTNEDTKLARKVFPIDDTVNAINIATTDIVIPIMKNHPEQMEQLLYLVSIIRKMERIGDLTKNMAEDTIFYLEAKVLKHQEKPKK
ncbi:MAG TPA: phosphate signaling complex protein PhoU [Edaphocola sp.]|nr:phosphate signaling complex protein PhoU [Edaphocola sp.]